MFFPTQTSSSKWSNISHSLRLFALFSFYQELSQGTMSFYKLLIQHVDQDPHQQPFLSFVASKSLLNFNCLMRYRLSYTQSYIFNGSLIPQEGLKSILFLFSKIEENRHTPPRPTLLAQHLDIWHLDLDAVLNDDIFRELMVWMHSYPVDSGRLKNCLAFSQSSLRKLVSKHSSSSFNWHSIQKSVSLMLSLFTYSCLSLFILSITPPYCSYP